MHKKKTIAVLLARMLACTSLCTMPTGSDATGKESKESLTLAAALQAEAHTSLICSSSMAVVVLANG